MTFALCMIVKNEENTLKTCLESVKEVFDEIVIVDTGSVDRTKQTALAYTGKVYDFIWCDDFAAARNFSFSKATSDFIMWLDADDVIDDQNRQKLLELKEKITLETDVVMMKYSTAFDSSGNPMFFYYRERLIKRGAGLMWLGFVHEVIVPAGNILYQDISVYHKPPENRRTNPRRNLDIYEAKLEQGVKFNARETYYFARELYYNSKFDRAAKHFEQFLTFKNGWFADKIGACLLLYEIYSKSNPEKAKDYLAKALSYDAVNPQVLCCMGDVQLNEGRINQAIFWYGAALACPGEYSANGFILPDYEKYYPLLQLCLCYDRLGDRQKAKEYNALAAKERPNSPAVKYNEEYFASLEE